MKREYENFRFFFWKSSFQGLFYARNQFRSFSKRYGRTIIFQGRWSRMYFDASGMRWIDFSHKITLRTMILEENTKFSYFRFNKKHSFPWIRDRETFSSFGDALNRFSHTSISFYVYENRFSTHIYFPESGPRKHFHASGMRAIDFSHMKINKQNLY